MKYKLKFEFSDDTSIIKFVVFFLFLEIKIWIFFFLNLLVFYTLENKNACVLILTKVEFNQRKNPDQSRSTRPGALRGYKNRKIY